MSILIILNIFNSNFIYKSEKIKSVVVCTTNYKKQNSHRRTKTVTYTDTPRITTPRSSHWRCSIKKGSFKNFTIFAGRNLNSRDLRTSLIRTSNVEITIEKSDEMETSLSNSTDKINPKLENKRVIRRNKDSKT